jgi:hypothetical protein
MRFRLEEAVRNARNSGNSRLYPGPDDSRVRDGVLFPEISPRFSLDTGTSIFTLGSCFSRSIEERLKDFQVPTMRLSVPSSERPGRPNGILNEYNPGTICQRLEYAARNLSFGDLCVAAEGDGFVDLLLPEYVTPSTKERLLERRAEVEQVYRTLSGCDAIIITFELVEAWYDKEAGLYLNRIPPTSVLIGQRDRFELHVLDVDETLSLLERIQVALAVVGIRKIIVIVSPVALNATYSGRDCVTANTYSKSVLVVCATVLQQLHPEVEYFPGYEIVMSAGSAFFDSDAVHLRDDVVDLVTGYLIERYTT